MVQNSNIHIRPGKPEDIPYVFSLIKALALFEKAPEAVLTSEQELLHDLFNNEHGPKLLMAEWGEAQVGMAIYYEAYSTWKGKMMFLDDLYVDENYRGKGIGKELMLKMFAICKEKGYRQMRWQVLDWNENAIQFYKSLGAMIDTEWHTCKMNFDASF